MGPRGIGYAQQGGGGMGWRTEPTAEMPVLRIDLSDAYDSLRQRSKALRRRRWITTGLAAVILATVFSVAGLYYVSNIPLPDAIAFPATTTVYYSDGTTVMARLGAQNRIPVKLAELPSYVSDAVVAAVDAGFWTDHASKISREYARLATGLKDTTYVGRGRALVLGMKLEDSYSKADILGFYLNTVYFGRGAYGVGGAAQAYFGVDARDLSLGQAVVLADVLASPGSGRFDPTVSPGAAKSAYDATMGELVAAGKIGADVARATPLPRVQAYSAAQFASGLDAPTGLVVQHVLSELRAAPQFASLGRNGIENGGYSIVTTVDARAQRLLEDTADETVPGSVTNGEPDNLQAAAVVVQPGTGRVLAYYGGDDGTGSDFAGFYYGADGSATGYGAHPPGQTFEVYALAAALKAGISVKSKWQSPQRREFPGRTGADAITDGITTQCQPTCTLAAATTDSLNVPYYALTEKLGAAAVVDMARATGIDDMWVPETATTQRQRYDLTSTTGDQVTPHPFGSEVALGTDPVTVVDQANAMATFAAGGLRAKAHFVTRVTSGGTVVYTEPDALADTRALSEAQANDLTWVLSQTPSAKLPDNRPSAGKTGVAPLRDSAVETAHAWMLGYTPNLAMAVWVGNANVELPLRDDTGARVTGATLPAGIYRAFMSAAVDRLALPALPFGKATFTGNAKAGDAR